MELNESARVLAELLRLHRWAGGETVSAARVFGLMHGFETVIRKEYESFGISEKMQRLVEDMLEDVDHGRQAVDGLAIKNRLQTDGVDEVVAEAVLKLCRLQGRFGDVIDQLVEAPGSVFSSMQNDREPEQNWAGALHYMELVDCTGEGNKKLHGVFAPVVPRIGEMVTPQGGSAMRVVDVEHMVVNQGDRQGIRGHFQMIPFVYLEEATEDDDD